MRCQTVMSRKPSFIQMMMVYSSCFLIGSLFYLIFFTYLQLLSAINQNNKNFYSLGYQIRSLNFSLSFIEGSLTQIYHDNNKTLPSDFEHKFSLAPDILIKSSDDNPGVQKVLSEEKPFWRSSLIPLIGVGDLTLEKRETFVQQEIRSLAKRIQGVNKKLEEIKIKIADRDKIITSIPLIPPVNGIVENSEQKYLSGQKAIKPGVDIIAAKGAFVVATADGTVEFAGSQGKYGKSIIISHELGIKTVYSKNIDLLVKEGQPVKRGEVIAQILFKTKSAKPIVHYEIKLDETSVDPRTFLNLFYSFGYNNYGPTS